MSANPLIPSRWTSLEEAARDLWDWANPSEPASSFGRIGDDGRATHFEASLGGPNAALLGIDWRDGVVRSGTMYLPKQDGGYSADALLAEDALQRLRELRGPVRESRFSGAGDAGFVLLATACPARRSWVQSAWSTLPGDGGDTDVLIVPCGHPLDAVILLVERTRSMASAYCIGAEGAVTPWGAGSVGPLLGTDLDAVAWPPGWTHDAISSGALARSVAEAMVRALAESPLPPSNAPESLCAFVDAHGPARWRLSEVRIGWGGPMWQYREGVPHATVLGTFRRTAAYVGVAFSADFAHATFLENPIGPVPAREHGTVLVPEPLRSAFSELYRPR